jgi:hypothetical protein
MGHRDKRRQNGQRESVSANHEVLFWAVHGGRFPFSYFWRNFYFNS